MWNIGWKDKDRTGREGWEEALPVLFKTIPIEIEVCGMNRLFAIALVLLLLTTGFSMLPEGVSTVEATIGPTRGVVDWTVDMNISDASHASFIGEDEVDNAGYSVAIGGDVNGDGYDDILIGANMDEEGGNIAGQVYVIFGKGTGWSMDTDLSNADASYLGEDA
ncbi:MAG: FG-GAP repeat protein [Thermoplasmata archaeon]|nr:FG-GAP repeat protein [Thermoplasmata archaeon]